MLKKFELVNYKNFEKLITLDFTKVGGYKYNEDCTYNNILSKIIMYGKNATGKTNFGRAILDIQENIYLTYSNSRANSPFLNANSKDKNAEFIYTFQFDKNEVIYRYKKASELILIQEELVLNGEVCFNYNFESETYNFEKLSILGIEEVSVQRFFDFIKSESNDDEIRKKSLSFLRWLINNTAYNEYSILPDLYYYVAKMTMIVPNTSMQTNPKLYNSFFDFLAVDDELDKFEGFLNYMGVKCKLSIEELPEGDYRLYFKHNKLIDFINNASSGTIALTNLYRRILSGKSASLLYLDEFDAYYHYEMSEKVILYFKENYPEYQIIMTTHNTNLMNNRIMRPDCLFILSQNGHLTPLCNATNRELREGHNLQKMFISGEFDDYE